MCQIYINLTQLAENIFDCFLIDKIFKVANWLRESSQDMGLKK